jgi:hypothetical protein
MNLLINSSTHIVAHGRCEFIRTRRNVEAPPAE